MFQGIGLPHLLIFALILFLVFGSKIKFSDMMGDVAKGIKSFKKGMADDTDDAPTLEASGEAPVSAPAPKTAKKAKS